MEHVQRFALYGALFIVGLFLWNAWHQQPVTNSAASSKLSSQTLQAPNSALPSSATKTDEMNHRFANLPTSNKVVEPQPTNKPSPRKLIKVKTGTLNVMIDPLGGTIVGASFPDYPEQLNTPDQPFALLTQSPKNFYVAESALISKQGPDTSTAMAKFTSDKQNYELVKGEQDLVVNLHWQNKQGLDVVKRFHFTEGSYLINVSYHIKNNGNTLWQGRYFTQITRKNVKPANDHLFQIHPYFGAAISSPEKRYQEVTFKEMTNSDLQKSIKNGWVAMVQRYFVSAWLPESDKTYQYYTKKSGENLFTIGMASPIITVKPGDNTTISARFYTGPEITSVLKDLAPGLELTVSYGWLWFISTIIFWVMERIYWIVGNWGWAIVLVTVLIKLMFYHLSAKSYQSMAKMRVLQPKVQALRDRYADDKAKQSQAMMELYKKEKVNPLGGCLPILVQIPVFFALYMVLIESVQLRQAPWILWIHDLSVPDPFFVLPVLMGISMFVQQKLNPPPADPTQAKVMMFLPVVFTVLFAYFPAGLVLYWVVNNTLSIMQQWYVTSRYEAKIKSHKKSYKKAK